jgi:hypothetical protein
MADILDTSNAWDVAKQKAFERVRNDFGALPYNCQDLDKQLKKIQDVILTAYKSADISLEQRAYREELALKKNYFEGLFSSHNCRDVIENIRLTADAVKETEYAIKGEQQVLGKNNKNQNIYIGIGGLVILVGLFVILKK